MAPMQRFLWPRRHFGLSESQQVQRRPTRGFETGEINLGLTRIVVEAAFQNAEGKKR